MHAVEAKNLCVQVGFVVRTENGHIGADVQECLPDYKLAFEGQTEDRTACFYYTCRQTTYLDEEYGDLLSIIHDFEVRHKECFMPRLFCLQAGHSSCSACLCLLDEVRSPPWAVCEHSMYSMQLSHAAAMLCKVCRLQCCMLTCS